MLNGIYKATFKTPIGAGYGTVYLSDGHIHGGDSGMYYVGSYETSEDKIEAHVAINTHTNIPGMFSVFGIDKVDIDLSGSCDEKKARLSGASPDAPSVKFSAELSFLCE